MPATTTLFRAARPIFQTSASRAAFRQATFRNAAGRRWQSTAGAAGEDAAKAQGSWFQRMWNSPVGLKTVHFW